MDELSPADAEIALRSLPRRFRGAVAAATDQDESPDELAHRAGPDGRSVVDLVVETVAGLSVLDRALARVLTSDDVVLDADVADPTRRSSSEQIEGAPHGLDDTLEDLEHTAKAFADRIGATAAGDWNRDAAVVGAEGPVRAIELVRQAVAESIDRLRAAEATIRAVRGVRSETQPGDAGADSWA